MCIVCLSVYLGVADLDAVAVTKTVVITIIPQRREEKSSVIKCSFQSTTHAQLPIRTCSPVNRCVWGERGGVSLCKQLSTDRPVWAK